MMWTLPKVDWQRTDSFNIDPDYIRIKGNIQHLHSMACRLYPCFEIPKQGDYTIDGLPYAEFFNNVELGLEQLYINTFRRPNFSTCVLADNGAVWDWRDLNRIERTLQQIYNDLLSVDRARSTLSFVMGGGAFAEAI